MDVASRSWDTGDEDNTEAFLRNRQAGGAFSKLAELMAQAEQKAEARSHHHHHKSHHHHHHHHQSAATVTTCAECHQDFPDVAALARHQQKHHTLRKPHRCKTCRQEFALLSSLQLHKCLGSPSSMCQLCHGKAQRGAPCSACSTDPSDTKGPRQHHHDSSPYACAPCGRAFSHKQELLYHQQAGGCQPAPLSPKAVKPSTTALASFTPAASTPTPSYASLPPSSPPMPAATACSFCSRVFRSAAGLANHQRTWHPSQADKDSTSTTMTKLPQKSAVKLNGKTSSEKIPGAKCKQDNLSDSATKKRDTGSSSGGGDGGGGGSGKKSQLFPCRSCDRVFSQTSTLHQHRREVHQREKRAWREHRTSAKSTRQGKKGETYPCPICGKVFLHHLTRWTHLRTHSAQQQEQQQQQNPVRKPLGRPPGAKPLGRPPGVKTLGRPPGSKPLGRPPKLTKAAEKHPLKKAKKSTKSGPTATKTEHKKRKKEQERRVAEEEEDEDDDDEDRDEDKEEEGREFPCPSCLEVFSSSSDLHKHEEVHQPAEVTITTCCVCSEDIAPAEGEEEGAAATAVPKLVYHCAPCRQAFSSLHSFLQHCRMHLPSDSDDGDGSETDSANEVG
ncbi:zinc finger protein 672 [Engraulis encrasicolus]|uniref:zinc finger protein 672 n=1 Tax=Engraulis encrasicolus TaxID=184585 RepID=UPI002FD77FDA